MARRRKNEGMMDLLVELPWWGALVLGLIFLGVSGGGSNGLVVLVFRLFAYACFLAAFVSAVKILSRKALFASANDIEAIRAMSWREFETLVGEAYRRRGYSVEETGGGGADGGIDLILCGKGHKIIVQCKQWRSFKVGVKVVREMYGILVAERADRVIVVASGVYTQDARRFARGKPIDLLDGRDLVSLIRVIKAPRRKGPSVLSMIDAFIGRQVALQKQKRNPQPPEIPMPPLDKPNALHVEPSSVPACPKCGSPMVLRTARKGPNAGGQFWGCPKYPACKGIVSVES